MQETFDQMAPHKSSAKAWKYIKKRIVCYMFALWHKFCGSLNSGSGSLPGVSNGSGVEWKDVKYIW